MTWLILGGAWLVVNFYWLAKYAKHARWYNVAFLLGLPLKIVYGIKRKEIYRFDNAKYLVRYTLHTNRWFSIKVHNLILTDDACLHDHPWPFISFMLWGGYKEERFRYEGEVQGYLLSVDNKTENVIRRLQPTISNKYHAPTILYRRANFAHRLIIDKPVWTLVVTFKKKRLWGFFTPQGWTYWRNYQQENQCE